MNKLSNEYNRQYSKIPNDLNNRIRYILKGKELDLNLMKTMDKLNRKIDWKIYSLILYQEPIPCSRPRFTMAGRVYVPHAAENGKFFEDLLKTIDNPIINTPCKVNVDFYAKTPSSYNINETLMCELKLLPNLSVKDLDNYIKSILDEVQHGLLSNDNIIISLTANKYYSIKPRIEITFEYMDKNIWDISKSLFHKIKKNNKH